MIRPKSATVLTTVESHNERKARVSERARWKKYKRAQRVVLLVLHHNCVQQAIGARAERSIDCLLPTTGQKRRRNFSSRALTMEKGVNCYQNLSKSSPSNTTMVNAEWDIPQLLRCLGELASLKGAPSMLSVKPVHMKLFAEQITDR